MLGRLEAIGTASQPITFTSAADTGAAQWSGLVFDGGLASGDLRSVTVRYGGNYNSAGGYSNLTVRNVVTREVQIESSRVLSGSGQAYTSYGSLYTTNGHVLVSDTLFSGNGYYADEATLRATSGSVITITGSTFQNNRGSGLYVAGGSLFSVTGSAIRNNAGYGIYATGATAITVTGNAIQNNGGYGVYATGGTPIIVTDNTIQNNGSWGVGVGADNLEELTQSGNVVSGNGRDRLVISGGTFSLGARLGPISLGGHEGYVLDSDPTVPAGVTLTVEPGILVMGQSNTELKVLGRLEAIGTASQPGLFSST